MSFRIKKNFRRTIDQDDDFDRIIQWMCYRLELYANHGLSSPEIRLFFTRKAYELGGHLFINELREWYSITVGNGLTLYECDSMVVLYIDRMIFYNPID